MNNSTDDGENSNSPTNSNNNNNNNIDDDNTTIIDQQDTLSASSSESSQLSLTSINFDNLCSICLNEVSVTSYADGCLHKFCGRCIFEWARRSQLCPICRTFFGNIITNVLSDTEYEVIPLENVNNGVAVFNFVRDSWWANNNRNNNSQQPSNRNIFAVRQFPRQPNSHQSNSQQQQTSSHPPMIQAQAFNDHQPIQSHPEDPLNPSQQLVSSQLNPQGAQAMPLSPVIRSMNDLFIDNRRPRRINSSPAAHPRVIWSSNHFNRHTSRPCNRQSQQHHPRQPPSLPPPPTPPIQAHHQARQNYNLNQSHHPLSSHRHSWHPQNVPPMATAMLPYQLRFANRLHNDRGHFRPNNYYSYGPGHYYNNQGLNNYNANPPPNRVNHNSHHDRLLSPQRPLRPLVGVRQVNMVSSPSPNIDSPQNSPQLDQQFHPFHNNGQRFNSNNNSNSNSNSDNNNNNNTSNNNSSRFYKRMPKTFDRPRRRPRAPSPE